MAGRSSTAFGNVLIVPLALLVAILIVLTLRNLQGSSIDSGGGSGGGSQLQTCLAQVTSLQTRVQTLTAQTTSDATTLASSALSLANCSAAEASLTNINTFLTTGFQPCVAPPANLVDLQLGTLVCSIPVGNLDLISFNGIGVAGVDTGLVVDWQTSCTGSVTTLPGVLACPPAPAASKRQNALNCVLPANVDALVCGGIALGASNLIYYDPQQGLYFCSNLQAPANPTAATSGCSCLVSGGAIVTCPNVGGLLGSKK